MQNCSEFTKGYEFCKEEVEEWVNKNKEIPSDMYSEREIIDATTFLEWLKEQ